MGKDSSASDDGSDEPEDFPSPEIEAAHFKAKYLDILSSLQETKAELDDFQASSKELEDELEKELAANEARHEDVVARNVKLEGEKEEWKDKYLAAQKAHNLALGALQRELDTTKSERDRLKVSLRDLEMGVDDLERNERMVSSSLQDAEARYNRAIEDKTMLEQELIGKQHLEEEAQRLKDEIRDLTTEVSVLREQRPRSQAFAHAPHLASEYMSPVRESSQELSMADLEHSGHNSSFESSSFASPSSANPGESPTPYVPRSHSPPTHFSTFGVTSIHNSPSTSRLPLPASPSQLPRSATARVLSGYTTDRSSTTSSPTSGPSRSARPTPSTGARSSTAGRATGARGLLLNVREQASKIGNKIPSGSNRSSLSSVGRSSKPLPGTQGAVPPPRGALSKSRTNVLAATAPRTPGTPGTPGADWVMVSEGEDSPTPAASSSALANGGKATGGGLRKSTTQTFSLGAKPKPTSTSSTLPTRNAIPSPLGAPYSSQTLPNSRARPPSRLRNLSSSTHASRPTTPTHIPIPSSTSSSRLPRPSSPALGIVFPSSSSSASGSRPRVLGASTSSRQPNPTSYTSTGDGTLRRSIRRLSLDQSADPPPLPAPSSRLAGSRMSFGSSSTNSRPQSAPVPPRVTPPVPAIPANFVRRPGVVGQASTSRQETLGHGRPEEGVAGRGARTVLARRDSLTQAGGAGRRFL